MVNIHSRGIYSYCLAIKKHQALKVRSWTFLRCSSWSYEFATLTSNLSLKLTMLLPMDNDLFLCMRKFVDATTPLAELQRRITINPVSQNEMKSLEGAKSASASQELFGQGPSEGIKCSQASVLMELEANKFRGPYQVSTSPLMFHDQAWALKIQRVMILSPVGTRWYISKQILSSSIFTASWGPGPCVTEGYSQN